MTRQNFFKRMYTKLLDGNINEDFVKILVETGKVSEEEKNKKPDYYAPSNGVIGDTINKYNHLIDSYGYSDYDEFDKWFKEKSKNYNDSIIDAVLKKWINKHGYNYILKKHFDGIRRRCVNKKIFMESSKFYFEHLSKFNLLDECLFEADYFYKNVYYKNFESEFNQIIFDRFRLFRLFLNGDETHKLIRHLIPLGLFGYFYNHVKAYCETDSVVLEPIHAFAGFYDNQPFTIEMNLSDSNGHSCKFEIHQKEFDMLVNGQVVDFNPKNYKEKYYTNFDCNVYAARIINAIYNKNIFLAEVK